MSRFFLKCSYYLLLSGKNVGRPLTGRAFSGTNLLLSLYGCIRKERCFISTINKPGDYGRFESGIFLPPEGYTLIAEPHPGIRVYTSATDKANPNLGYKDPQFLNPVKYIEHNFAQPAEVDTQGMAKMAEALERLGIQPGSLHSVMDCGCNTNAYPAMLVAPSVQEGGQLVLNEVSNPAREYQKALYDSQGRHGFYYVDVNKQTGQKEIWVINDVREIWGPFSEHATEVLNSDKNPFTEAQHKVTAISPNTLAELPADRYALSMAHSVVEAVANNRLETFQNICDLISSAEHEGGAFLMSGMLQSGEWEYGVPGSSAYLTGDYLRIAYEGRTVLDKNGQSHYIEPVVTGLKDVKVEQIDAPGGIGASSSSGMYVVSGRRSGGDVGVNRESLETLEKICCELDPQGIGATPSGLSSEGFNV